jgi:hypothetical protein
VSVGCSEAVQTEWARRVAAEFGVSLVAQDLAQRLTLFGAPVELIEDALTMAIDELQHARLARLVCDAAGVQGPVVFDPTAYESDRAVDPAVHIAVLTVPNLCLGETLAIRIVHRLRENANTQESCVALDRVLADEPRHAALGWQIVDWLLDTPSGPAVRDAIHSELARWTSILEAGFAGPELEPHLEQLTEDDLAWGLAKPDDYRTIFHKVVANDWTPRLRRRQLLPA